MKTFEEFKKFAKQFPPITYTKLTKEEYETLMKPIICNICRRIFNPTEEDIKTANNKLKVVQNEIYSIEGDSSCYVEYIDIIKNFLDVKNPTKEIMNRLIDKIYVTKDKKLEIHYRIKKSEVLV